MEKSLEISRHSLAHLVAAAVQSLYPQAKFGVGPVVENGFYYDIDFKENIGEEDLARIQKKAEEMVEKNLEFIRQEMSLEEAVELFSSLGQDYKVSLLQDLRSRGTTKMNAEEAQDLEGTTDRVSLYQVGDFVDLCRAPHVATTKEIGAFKLVKLAGAYWRGDVNNPQLQRIYGVCFASAAELESYLNLLVEAEKRDHKRIGKELDLFSFHEEGPGFPFFHNKGMIILNELIAFWREKHRARNYQEIKTPAILSRKLWETSGHWDLYSENMYTTKIDEIDYAVKPMNCPGGILLYKEHLHSYRELPLRIGELGHVHRHELSGVLNGLFRVRAFTQDDAHVFCTKEQLEEEIIDIVQLIKEMFSQFGFSEHKFTLSIRGEKKKDKYLGTDQDWEWAQNAILGAMKKLGIDCEMMPGEAKFYGPSLDVQIKDALKREWQCSTIQLDFNLPARFDVSYMGEDGKEHTPFMLHRVVYGSLERFLGILVEQYAGAFPVWLAPVQLMLVPVSSKHLEKTEVLARELSAQNIRVEVQRADETVAN